MLTITVPAVEESEVWDEKEEQFISVPPCKEQVLQLEHSLISLSKWESKWCIPFNSDKEKTIEQTIDYIKCMTLNKNVDQKAYDHLTKENLKEVTDYIYAPMTATTIREDKRKGRNREIITSEVIYYWMIANNIPFECEKWHLNRLITLIKVCASHNEKPKKMSQKELVSQYARINAANRKKFNSKG